jgi:hypothetical protein
MDTVAVLREIRGASHSATQRNVSDPGDHGRPIRKAQRGATRRNAVVQTNFSPVSLSNIIAQQADAFLVINDRHIHRTIIDPIFDAFFNHQAQGSGMGVASAAPLSSRIETAWATPKGGRGASFHFSLPTVIYPRAYHEFETPSNSKDRMERNLAWYAHYLIADGTPARSIENIAEKERVGAD